MYNSAQDAALIGFRLSREGTKSWPALYHGVQYTIFQLAITIVWVFTFTSSHPQTRQTYCKVIRAS